MLKDLHNVYRFHFSEKKKNENERHGQIFWL